MIIYEVVTEDVAGVLAAEAGGAHRIEFCSALDVGGLTPSIGMLQVALQRREHIPIMVMVRPRAGDFCYNETEFATMLADIDAIKATGVEGVVFGILHPDGTVDAERTHELVLRARPMLVTFHRAFDMTVDPYDALETLIEVGFDRILTSGQEATALKGMACIQQLVKQADGRITILAGSGVRPTNVHKLVVQTGVQEVHSSARSTSSGQAAKTQSAMTFRNPRLSMGVEGCDEYALRMTDQRKVRKMVEVLGRV